MESAPVDEIHSFPRSSTRIIIKLGLSFGIFSTPGEWHPGIVSMPIKA